jgi:hypothetical protein
MGDKMTILVYTERMAVREEAGRLYLEIAIERAFATADIVLPCSGEVIAEAGTVSPLTVNRALIAHGTIPQACWEGKNTLTECQECWKAEQKRERGY